MKYYNIVFCTHEDKTKPYIFALPMDKEVKEYEQLCAYTKRGFKSDLVAVSTNLMVSEYTAKTLTKILGGTWPLAEICGTAKTEYKPVTTFKMFPEKDKELKELPF